MRFWTVQKAISQTQWSAVSLQFMLKPYVYGQKIINTMWILKTIINTVLDTTRIWTILILHPWFKRHKVKKKDCQAHMECAGTVMEGRILVVTLASSMIFGLQSARTVHGATNTRVSSWSSCTSIRHAHTALRCYLSWRPSAHLSDVGLKSDSTTQEWPNGIPILG
jgi:hypothetical protein